MKRKLNPPGISGRAFCRFSGYTPAGSGTVSTNTAGITMIVASCSDRCIMVETTGLEPVTSCV